MLSASLRARLARCLPILFAAFLMTAPAAGPASADKHFPDDPDEAYDEWVDMFAEWTIEDAKDAGYTPTDECVVGPPDLGNMGRHFISISRLTSGKVDPADPHVVLFDENDEMVGIEWEIEDVRDPAPTVGGLELEFTPPHEGMDYDHMSRHVYFVGEKAHRFTTFNPAVACSDEAMAKMDDDYTMGRNDSGEDVRQRDDDAGYGDEGRDRDDDPYAMPTTGFADGMPGGTFGLLAIAAALMATLGLLGRRAEARQRG